MRKIASSALVFFTLQGIGSASSQTRQENLCHEGAPPIQCYRAMQDLIENNSNVEMELARLRSISTNPYWTPIHPIHDIAGFDIANISSTESAFDIPSSVPPSAREVLVHIHIASAALNSGGLRRYEISTIAGNITRSFPLFIVAENHETLSNISNVYWLPVDGSVSTRKIYMRLVAGSPIRGNRVSFMSVVGFR